MITNEQRMIWRTAWLQHMCEQHGIPYTGTEIADDLEVKLINAKVSFNQGVDVYYITGTTNDPSTNVGVGPTRFIIPDLQITVPMLKGQKAIVSATLSTRAASGSGMSPRHLVLNRSINGGSWGDLGSWISSTAPRNEILPVSLSYAYIPNNDQTVTFGVRMASDGETTLYAHVNHRMMTVIVV